ncbi:hypothetical protein CWI42_010480 [Ordospora colligata]|uniref:Uncharacterized protein n=1 Tax=Ordospora colligata OC4 TaxID=1354746 RepID=A0A0B2UH53_9MICR|nr:uncharacterized protein M896_010480 [Ordospora colligata OC4]KHN70396.1 hypothetical protein M896_010480 [Ordospora colligata OC4]TBU17146.1 hypothetical protein CWI41_010480 [Ordospora colligata]TBU17396.1 hypothetical protein CWI40_010480 [Ordospora colligata]TBU19576.1 hypothetical protein CWI42_010480 [Ordospora colligata]
MKWILSLCCRSVRKRYAVTLLGLQNDQRRVLQYLNPNGKDNKNIRPFSEDVCVVHGMELVLQSLDDDSDLYEIRGIHVSHCAAVMFSVDADDSDSVEKCVSLLNEEVIKTKDVVVVFCKSNVYGSVSVDALRRSCEEIGHGKIEFVVYEDEKIAVSVQKGVDWICNRLDD